MKKIEAHSVQYAMTHKWPNYEPADQFVIAVVVNSDVITKSVDVYATVETKGQYTWGQMVVDWLSMLKKPKNVTLITEIDHKKFTDLLYKAVDKTPP